MSNEAVVLDEVVVQRGGRPALTVDRLVLPEAAVVAVIGANGSGKSTLLDVVAGLLPAVTGSVRVAGRSPDRAREVVAYVPQSTTVPEHLPITVREAVTLGVYREVGAWRPLGATRRRRIEEAMDRLDVTALAERQIHELSGGQRQRVLVAQGLVAGAPVLLLDEPVTGLDLPSRARILEVVAAERDAGRTVLVATHELEEARAADVVVLLAGRVVAVGSPEEVLTAPNLAAAYGGRIIEVADGAVLLDDPHHHHHHH